METGLSSETVHKSWFTREERQDYARRLLAYPIALFVALTAGYLAAVTLVLAAPLLVAVPLAIPCGMLIGMLFIIGHDAVHNSFTRSRRVNQVIGHLVLLPSLHAYSLWDLAHTNHHIHNNLRGFDYVWEPMTPAEFRALGSVRRAWYMFQRTPAGVAFHYLTMIWAPRLVIPWPSVIGRARLVYWLDSAFVLGGLALQIIGVIAIGATFGKSPEISVLTGVLLPFLVWNGFMSFIIFLHHTHPDIKWFRDETARAGRSGTLRGTSWVRFPTPFRQMTFGIMEHNAHHYASGVPLYHLPRMQASLDEQGHVVTWRFTWRDYAAVCRACKLYDYDADRWVRFDEEAT